MAEYGFGEYVVYKPNNQVGRIGRVTECRESDAFVCYTSGCTAACTPLDMLRKATEDEIAHADKTIGFHRFDRYCPERIDWCCSMCGAEKEE